MSHCVTPVNNEQLAVLRFLYRFPEIVQQAATEYAPNHLCTYLFEIAQRFNTFYNKHSILGANPSPDRRGQANEVMLGEVSFRLQLTEATAQVIKNGLYLLGIETPERM